MLEPNAHTDRPTTRERGALAALRYVLASAIDRETAFACLARNGPVTLAPSGPYQILAASAASSPSLWRRCARLIDASLGPAVFAFEDTPSAQLVELVESGLDVLRPNELAALVWSLLRRRDPALSRVLEAIPGAA